MERLKLSKKIIAEKKFEEKRLQTGYNPVQVDAFLDEVIQDYDIFERNINELKDEIATLKGSASKSKGANKETISQITGIPASNIGRFESVTSKNNKSAIADDDLARLQALTGLDADSLLNINQQTNAKKTTAKVKTKKTSKPNQPVKGGMADILNKID